MTCPTEMRRRASLTRAKDDLARLARQASDPRNSDKRTAMLVEKIAVAKALVTSAKDTLEEHRGECGC
jgi:hypothetical protein